MKPVENRPVPDLDLAKACAEGDESAWEQFVEEYRPLLYRAAAAIDTRGGGRDLADSIYAELYGLTEKGGERRSLFRYYHGRSKLSTWLRAVLAQRYVDSLREARRREPLPDDDSMTAPAPQATADPERARFVHVMRTALAAAIAALTARDRLRLGCYYAQDMTLAAIGKMLHEHEATVSRQLARTRREIRQAVEDRLRNNDHMDEHAIAECFRSVVEDAGAMDLAELLGTATAGKKETPDRSKT